MIKAKINGREYDFPASISILEGARSIGSDIPTLCNDPRLKPVGACRLCLVRVKGKPGFTASCMEEITAGMEIETESAELDHLRQMNLKMLARSYPVEAFLRYPEKPFHRLAAGYGLTESDFSKTPDAAKIDDSHPLMRVDMSRCIECFRCIRICNEVQGQFVWQHIGFGSETRILPDSFAEFGSSSCVSCGACSDSCPTGAIEDRSYIESGPALKWGRTTCPYCGTGCEMDVGTIANRIVQIKPAIDSPVSHGHLCVKGRYAFEFTESPERITEPMIRSGEKWEAVSWDEVIRYIAERLSAITSANGADSVGILGSARATNEENYLVQKFARLVLGTHNVDNCARVCHTPTAAAMKMMLGTGAATNSFDDIEQAETFLICGANPLENHPIAGARIKQAILKGAKLIMIDPRGCELAKYADIHLAIKPGTNIPLLNSLAHAIIDEGLFDADFIRRRVDAFDEYREFIAEYSPERVADICGVAAGRIRAAARLYALSKPAMAFHGLGVTEHSQGTEGVMCLVNLALITGNIGQPGSGINPLRGQNNVQGAAHMGCDPGILTGSVAVAEAGSRFEEVWGGRLPATKGLNLLQMIDSAREGRLKALWTVGYDVFLTLPNSNETARAFENLELCIVQDLFLNETAKRYGHVFLPAASSFEKEGTFMNSERRVQRVRKVIEPHGNCLSDQEIICRAAEAFGQKDFFNFDSAEDVWNEIRRVWPGAFGITYSRIEAEGLQWDCPTTEHPGTGILHTDAFTIGEKASLRRVAWRPTKETADDDFPFILITGRALYQFNAGTMTMRSDVMKLRPTDNLDISPEDASRLGLSAGDRVIIKSRYGEAALPVCINHSMKPGELFATFHDPHVFLNRLTSGRRDRFVQTPEYKVTAVRLEKSPGQSEPIG